MMQAISKIVLLVSTFAGVLVGALGTAQSNIQNGQWVGAWTAMPQLTEPANLPQAPYVCHEKR